MSLKVIFTVFVLAFLSFQEVESKYKFCIKYFNKVRLTLTVLVVLK